MRARVLCALSLALLWCTAAAYAQQPQQPLTFVSDYYVRFGKDDEFMQLVKTVGAPVRDKLLAEGVILAWGVDVPVMRAPGQPNYSIWYTVATWDGIQKVQAAMRAQLTSLAEQDQKAAEVSRKKGGKAPKSTAERIQEVFEVEKTRDWIFRDIEAHYSKSPPPAGAQPFTYFELDRVHPGKGLEYRQLLDKHDKPVLDKLLTDGVIGAYGIGTEEVVTTREFTHYTWASVLNLADLDKILAAFDAEQAKRSPEENSVISQSYRNLVEHAAHREFILHSIIFKVGAPPQK